MGDGVKLNSEQSEALDVISVTVAQIAKKRDDYTKLLALETKALNRELREQVKAADAIGVPKSRIRAVSGIRSMGAFYDLLREAGVPIGDRPTLGVK